jgi:hypothetical protein
MGKPVCYKACAGDHRFKRRVHRGKYAEIRRGVIERFAFLPAFTSRSQLITKQVHVIIDLSAEYTEEITLRFAEELIERSAFLPAFTSVFLSALLDLKI